MALITREQDKMDNCDGQSNSVPMMGAGICVASHATDVQAVNAHLVSDGLAQTQDQRTRLEKELTSVRVQLSDKLAEISKLEEKLRTAQLAHQDGSPPDLEQEAVATMLKTPVRRSQLKDGWSQTTEDDDPTNSDQEVISSKLDNEKQKPDESIIRYFLRDADVEGNMVKALSEYMIHLQRMDNTSGLQGPEQTMTCILELTEQDLTKALYRKFSKSLVKHQRVMQERKSAEMARKSAEAASDGQLVNGKFVDYPEAAFGDSEHFHKGLNMIGVPHPKIDEYMQKEFKEQQDSNDEFESWNSGKIVTNPSKEWDFVVEPFDTASIRKDKSPIEWQPKYTYGGSRTPIRLQVFLHALSAYSSDSKGGGGVQFGEYKTACERECSDPLWLHEEELCMVKLVLLQFIKSQLDGAALWSAFKMEIELADSAANKICHILSTAFSDPCKHVVFDILSAQISEEVQIDVEALLDYFHKKLANRKFTKLEVIAIRLYTGPPYVKLNGSLRASSGFFDSSMTKHLKGNTYVNTIFANASALRKLSSVTSIPKTRKVYRGISGYKLPTKFVQAMEGGGRGGVEFAFMSTTTKMEVAVSYISSEKGLPIVFEFDVGYVDRGSSVSFMSQFPGEDEVLIPALSFLEIVGEPYFHQTVKGNVTVYPARINCNLKSQTVEEIEARRKHDIVDLMPYLLHDFERDVSALSEALRKDGLLRDNLKLEKEEGCDTQPVVDVPELQMDTIDEHVYHLLPNVDFSRTTSFKFKVKSI